LGLRSEVLPTATILPFSMATRPSSMMPSSDMAEPTRPLPFSLPATGRDGGEVSYGQQLADMLDDEVHWFYLVVL